MVKRYGVLCTEPPTKPRVSWMTDGDQDGDRWEGSLAQANSTAKAQRKIHPKGWKFKVTPIPEGE
jgi:hypothetical protein